MRFCIEHDTPTTTTPLRVRDYPFPAALELVPYGPGIVHLHERAMHTLLMFTQFPTLDEARAALALGWRP